MACCVGGRSVSNDLFEVSTTEDAARVFLEDRVKPALGQRHAPYQP